MVRKTYTGHMTYCKNPASGAFRDFRVPMMVPKNPINSAYCRKNHTYRPSQLQDGSRNRQRNSAWNILSIYNRVVNVYIKEDIWGIISGCIGFAVAQN